jgi:DnaK suppressor protein
MDQPLSREQLEALRDRLEVAERETLAGLAASTADAKPVGLELSIGRLTRVDALQSQHMAEARRQRLTVQLAQIRSALGRVRDGSYGVCAECGEPIPFERLKARPEALQCKDCVRSGSR